MGGSRQGRGGYFFLPVSSSAGEALVCLCALAYLCHKFYREGDCLTECMLLSVHSLCALLVQLALPKPESSSVMRDLRTRKCDSQGHFLSSFLLLAFVTTSITRAKHGRGVGDEGGAGDGDLVQHVVHAFVTLTVALSNFKYSQLLKMHSILQITSLCALLHASYQLYQIQQTFTWFATISIPLSVFTSELTLQSCRCIPSCFTLGDAQLISNASMAVVIKCVMHWHSTWAQYPHHQDLLLLSETTRSNSNLLTQTGLLYAAIMYIALVMRLSTGDFDQSLPSVSISALICFLCAMLYPTSLSGLVGASRSLFGIFAANAGLLAFWTFIVCVTIPSIMLLEKGNLLSNIVIRKLFHLAALAVFISAIHMGASERQGDFGGFSMSQGVVATPSWRALTLSNLMQRFTTLSSASGLQREVNGSEAQATEFLGFCSAALLCVLVLCEYIRIQGRASQFSVHATTLLRRFTDSRDSGTFIISHLSLLIGLSTPVWLHSAKLSSTPDKHIPGAFVLASGTMVLGIADVLGVLIGRHFGIVAICKGSKKTLEGTVSAAAGMIGFALLWDHVSGGSALTSQTSQGNLLSFVLACVATCLLEAFTLQLDNLYVPLYFYVLLINVH